MDSQTAQNYRLNTDIDFTGKINPKTNVSIGRLEAEGEGHTLKNLEVTVKGTGKGFIKEIKNSLKNITFENITVNNTATSGNYSGLIARNVAIIENVNFKDITINAPKIGYIGMIANNSGAKITNINLENIIVTGKEHVAGLMGLTESGIFNNITVKKANIKGTSNYTGGVIGRITSKIYYNIGDITVTDSKIQVVNYTGGVIGN